MTSQDVDPETYYAVGTGLFEKAGELYDAFNVNVASSAAPAPWLVLTMQVAHGQPPTTAVSSKYWERQRSDQGHGELRRRGHPGRLQPRHRRTQRHARQSRSRAVETARARECVRCPVSSTFSRWPGQGSIDAIGLMQQVGVPVPDGDTDKVSTAAGAWDRLATVYQTKTIVEALEVDARAFRDTHSPEVEYIVRDLEELRDATSSVLDGCAELSQSCKDYESALGDLRTQLKGILNDLAVELAVTATVAIAASFISFGAGAVQGRRRRRNPSPSSRGSSPKPLVRGRSRRTSPRESRGPTTSPACARSCSGSRTLGGRGSRTNPQ